MYVINNYCLQECFINGKRSQSQVHCEIFRRIQVIYKKSFTKCPCSLRADSSLQSHQEIFLKFFEQLFFGTVVNDNFWIEFFWNILTQIFKFFEQLLFGTVANDNFWIEFFSNILTQILNFITNVLTYCCLTSWPK